MAKLHKLLQNMIKIVFSFDDTRHFLCIIYRIIVVGFFWIPWLQISRKFLCLFDYIINWLGSYGISYISVILMPILNLRRRGDKEHKFVNYLHSMILNNMFHYELNILKWICQISNILFVVLLLSFSVDSTT